MSAAPQNAASAPGRERRTLSPATYATLMAMVMVILLSAFTLTAASSQQPARPAYDPSVSLLGLTTPD